MSLRCIIYLLWASLLVAGAALGARAQVHTGNAGGYEWIVPSAQYAKIIVNESAVYYALADSLIAQNSLLNGQSIAALSLWYRGVQQPFALTDADASGTLSPGDTLEFVGLLNDGWLDSVMYRDAQTGIHDPTIQAKRQISLFTNESAYFLAAGAGPGMLYTRSSNTRADAAALTPEPYYRDTTNLFEIRRPVLGSATVFDPQYTLNSDYVLGEGFGNPDPPYRRVLPMPGRIATPVNPPIARMRAQGTTRGLHTGQFTVGSQATPFDSDGLFIATAEQAFTPAEFISAGVALDLVITGTVPNERYATHWWQVEYDRSFNQSGERQFIMPYYTPPVGAAYLQVVAIDGVPASQDSLLVFDPLLGSRHSAPLAFNGSTVNDTGHVVLPASVQQRSLFISTRAGRRAPVGYAPARFTQSYAAGAGAPYVIIAHRNWATAAEAYATYRSSNPYNAIQARVFYTDELYDQYSYGSFSPLAIKRFMNEALSNWASPPEYLLLLGKGYYSTRVSNGEAQVPGWGYPVSDYEYVTNFDLFSPDTLPQLSVGRVNIKNNQMGLDYLNKVQTYEATPYQDWMKQILHLGGGISSQEQQDIRFFLEGNIEPVLEGNPFQGDVAYYQKSNTDPVESNALQEAAEVINAGANLLTFFGHSSSNIFDIAIERPEAYTNFGRFPFIVANGCYSGDFASFSTSFGEDFIAIPERGAIGYLSMSGQGVLNFLGAYTFDLTSVLFRDSIGIRVGDGVRLAQNVFRTRSNPSLVRMHIMQFNLQGDPALRLYHPTAPDLLVEEAAITTTPDEVSTQLVNFTLEVPTRNIGLAATDSFAVRITQLVAATGEQIIYNLPARSLASGRDTIRQVVELSGASLAGLNTFTIELDVLNAIAEMDEANNRATFELEIASDLPALLSPQNYAIITTASPTLRAARFSSDSASALTYRFELDTLRGFNSPALLQSGPVAGSSVEASWAPPITLVNQRVYYWRVQLDGAPADRWTYGSFQYRSAGSPGWQQSAPAQWAENAATSYTIDTASFAWSFDPINTTLYMGQIGNRIRLAEYNGVEISTLAMRTSANGVFYAIIDGTTLGGQTSDPAYGSFIFLNNLPTLEADLTAVINGLGTGDHLLLFASGNPQLNWAAFPSLQAAFYTVGASTTFTSQDSNGVFIFVGTKGQPSGTATEAFIIGNVLQEINVNFSTQGNSGSLRPPLVGPASAWASFAWQWDSPDAPNYDELQLQLRATTADGQDSLLTTLSGTQLNYDLSTLDAGRWPFIALQLALADDSNRTAPQLRQWQALYSGLPDLSVDAISHSSFAPNEVYEGQPVVVSFDVRNISSLPMDSCIVRFEARNETNGLVYLGETDLPALAAGAIHRVSYTFATEGLPGQNTFIATINPAPGIGEQHRFNNLYTRAFTVQADAFNPAVDVLFDGKRITNGDVVAPSPEILIEVRDENLFLALDDTNAVQLYLKEAQDPSPARRVFFSDPNISFTPASGSGNRAQVRYTPPAFADGEYQLEVQGYDKLGNPAGTGRYEITFRVDSRNAVTRVMNYPNPFSTSTRFVYTLTGSQLPDVFQLHIYTVTGRLVKVIDLVEMGEVFFGTHITNYAWDGTDEHGDRLANGVYLYRVHMRLPDGSSPELNDTGVEQYFRKGWGKIVLFR